MKPFYQDDLVTLYHANAMLMLDLVPPVDFIFTDPPYGHNNNDGDLIANRERALGRKCGRKPNPARPIKNDGPEQANELVRWLFEIAAQKLRCCCCCCCCCGGGGPDPQFARWSLLMDQYLNFKQMIIWDKGRMGLGWHYRRSYETVLVAQKGKGKCKWYDKSYRIENIIRPGDHGIKKIIPTKAQHPTEKPVALSSHFIRLHSAPGDVVFDPFSGSGSTLIAAKQLRRRSIGFEIDEKWCRLAAKRLKYES